MTDRIVDGRGPRVGVLLAAGLGSRFDSDGRLDKLLAPLQGRPVVLHALGSLAGAVDRVVGVVRPGARGEQVADVLRRAGCALVVCEQAARGMGASLACAAAAVADWQPASVAVLLGDMPFVAQQTVARVVEAVRRADDIAAASWGGRRGHPVAFGAAHLPALRELDGDRGAVALLQRHALILVDAGDPGVLRDIDTPADLAASTGLSIGSDTWPRNG